MIDHAHQEGKMSKCVCSFHNHLSMKDIFNNNFVGSFVSTNSQTVQRNWTNCLHTKNTAAQTNRHRHTHNNLTQGSRTVPHHNQPHPQISLGNLRNYLKGKITSSNAHTVATTTLVIHFMAHIFGGNLFWWRKTTRHLLDLLSTLGY